MVSDLDPQTSRWHQDRRVPMATILTIGVGLMVQTITLGGGFAYYAGQNNEQVRNIREVQESREPLVQRFLSLESTVNIDRKAINSRLDRIEDKLDRVIESQSK